MYIKRLGNFDFDYTGFNRKDEGNEKENYFNCYVYKRMYVCN